MLSACAKFRQNTIKIKMMAKIQYLTQGRMQDFSGGGPNFKISGILDIHAAKLRAFARGVWGHAPPRKFLKMVQFRGF